MFVSLLHCFCIMILYLSMYYCGCSLGGESQTCSMVIYHWLWCFQMDQKLSLVGQGQSLACEAMVGNWHLMLVCEGDIWQHKIGHWGQGSRGAKVVHVLNNFITTMAWDTVSKLKWATCMLLCDVSNPWNAELLGHLTVKTVHSKRYSSRIVHSR